MDFSDRAIALARSLSEELGIEAKFLCSDIYGLPHALDNKFDIVFTSHGVLSWLPDLGRWAQVISHFLKPGGTFYMVEGHPIVDVFDAKLRPHFPYFHSPEPFEYLPDGIKGSYADPDTPVASANYQWQHSMADILNSLITSGLRIEFFHEFAHSTYEQLPFMERGEDGLWRLRDGENSVPLMFSLRAAK